MQAGESSYNTGISNIHVGQSGFQCVHLALNG